MDSQAFFEPFRLTADDVLRSMALDNLPRIQVLGRVFESGMYWGFSLTINGEEYLSSTGYDTEEEARHYLDESLRIARVNGYDAKLDLDLAVGPVPIGRQNGIYETCNGAGNPSPGTVTC